jgi:hypothetical protein
VDDAPTLPFALGRPQAASVDYFRRHLADRVKLVVQDGGVARSRAIDERFVENYEAMHGRGSVYDLAKRLGIRPHLIMEADWMAGTTGFVYISPHVKQFAYFGWPGIELTPLEHRRPSKCGVRIASVDMEQPYDFLLGAPALANLIAIARHYDARVRAPEAISRTDL